MLSKLSAENLVLAVTSRCNLRCGHCQVRKENKDMTIETAWKAVSLFLEKKDRSGRRETKFRRREIKFFGGEPLLCFELIKRIVNRVNQQHKNIKFKLPTNGILLDEEMIKFLNDNPNVELVVSSSNISLLEEKAVLTEKMLKLPQTTVSINFLPNKIGDGEKKFVRLFGRGFSRFNFLPVYFAPWKRHEIKSLSQALRRIAKIIRLSPRRIYVANLEVKSATPLFNIAPTVDPEGSIMAGNFFLDKRFYPWKGELKLGNVHACGNWKSILSLSFDFDFLIEKVFSHNIIRSNMAIDRELTRFVEFIKTMKNK